MVEKLSLKVTYRCPATCTLCASRKASFTRGSSAGSPCDMDVELAEHILHAASTHGVGRVVLSGGEPTVYSHLARIVAFASAQGLPSKLNTNGWALPAVLPDLLEAGIGEIALSYYATNRDTFEQLRGPSDLFVRATACLDALSGIAERDRQGGPRVILQTVITKANFRELPALLRLCCERGFSALATSYLEDAVSCPELRMSRDDILEFEQNTAPEMRGVLRQYGLPDPSAARNAAVLDSYFKLQNVPWAHLAAGRYRIDDGGSCREHGKVAIVHPNSRVEYCYGTEYRLPELPTRRFERGYAKEMFTATGRPPAGYCDWCPAGLHMWLETR